MKKNNFFILLILLLVGCSKSKDYSTFVNELKKNSGPKEVYRHLANIDATKCLKDIFSVDMVKSEIKQLEIKQAKGTKVEGKWRHLNLADLSIPQANFLKTFGASLGDLNNSKAFDYSSCNDVPCIINKIYQKENHIAGYVHYLWYLKMGSYLSASNNVYDSKTQTRPGIYNGKELPVSAYLFRDEELYAFWRLMLMMKSPHTVLTKLKEITRVPQGESFDFTVEKRQQLERENLSLVAQGKRPKPIPLGETCGLSYSNGYIILQDLCLSVGQDQDSGSFYDSVLHELTHQVDFHEGSKLNTTHRSFKSDYLELSGFWLEEYKNERNETIRQWKLNANAKLPSAYGGTSPAENFAETISLFRTKGTLTKTKISEIHWAFTSKNYFADKSFDKTTIIKNWINTQSSLLAQLSLKAVSDCSKSNVPSISTYFRPADFTLTTLPSMINCLGAKAIEISQDVSSKIKISEPDGCSILNEYNMRDDWEPALKSQLSSFMSKYLNELQNDKTYFAKVQSFYDRIPDIGLANKAYLECYQEDLEEDCYNQEVHKLALLEVASLNLPEVHASELANLYLASHPYLNTEQYMKEIYRSFVLSHSEIVNQAALDIWATCEKMGISDEVSPEGRFFTISDGYMVSSLYTCINAKFYDTVKEIVRDLSVDGIKVQHPKEEMILYSEVIPTLQRTLLSLFAQKKEREGRQIRSYVEKDEGNLRKEILSNFSWVKNISSNAAIIDDCHALAFSKITFPLLYQTKAQAFGVLVQNSCQDVQMSNEFNFWTEESKSVFEEKSLESLQNLVLSYATAKAKDCLVQYPNDTNLNRIKHKTNRDACLMNSWTAIEDQAIKIFSSDPLVIKFKIDPESLRVKLEANRRKNQVRIMKENF